jgi:hypothetical protein
MNNEDNRELEAIAGCTRAAIQLALERELRVMNSDIDNLVRRRLSEGESDAPRQRSKLKFGPLFEYFKTSTQSEIALTFAELGEIIGEPLSASAYKWREYWFRYGRSRLADCWYANGYRIKKLELEAQSVTF